MKDNEILEITCTYDNSSREIGSAFKKERLIQDIPLIKIQRDTGISRGTLMRFEKDVDSAGIYILKAYLKCLNKNVLKINYIDEK